MLDDVQAELLFVQRIRKKLELRLDESRGISSPGDLQDAILVRDTNPDGSLQSALLARITALALRETELTEKLESFQASGSKSIGPSDSLGRIAPDPGKSLARPTAPRFESQR